MPTTKRFRVVKTPRTQDTCDCPEKILSLITARKAFLLGSQEWQSANNQIVRLRTRHWKNHVREEI